VAESFSGAGFSGAGFSGALSSAGSVFSTGFSTGALDPKIDGTARVEAFTSLFVEVDIVAAAPKVMGAGVVDEVTGSVLIF